jgi:exodeoxyribonuclease VII large subunit
MNAVTMPAAGDAPPTVDSPWPVGVLSNKIRGYIERLGTAWVEGEIVQWCTASSRTSRSTPP